MSAGLRPPSRRRAHAPPPPSPSRPQAAVVDQLKCEDVTVLHVEPIVSWTSYVVLATVRSRPQLLAAQYRCDEAAAAVGRERTEGKPGKTEWEMLDYGDVVVSVMTGRQREFYDLESFYGQAEEVPLPFP